MVSYLRAATDQTTAGTDRAMAVERARDIIRSMDIGGRIDIVNGG